MYAPGFYKTNYRRLRFQEFLRMYGMPAAFKAYLRSRFMRPGGGAWMPSLWADGECKREDLSEGFWKVAKPHRLAFERLGFAECGYSRATSRSLALVVRDSGGIAYWDATRSHVGKLHYHRLYSPKLRKEIYQLVIAFTAAFEQGSLVCTNQKFLFDVLDDIEVIRVDSHDATFIHQTFIQRLQQRREVPRQLPDLESLRQWFDARQLRHFEERVRRGLFVPMTDEEVAVAKARLEQAVPEAHIRSPRFRFNWAFLLALVGVVFVLHFFRNPTHRRTDTIEYLGQEFKMRKAYSSYEDYKDDPDNLDTNELDRIEQVMVGAKVPASFKSRKEFTSFLFDLKFPGYGLGFAGERAQTDDGSALEVEAVEVPQRNKDRVIVALEADGQLKVIDDFVSDTSTNEIRQVKIENRKLMYYNQRGDLVREKGL